MSAAKHTPGPWSLDEQRISGPGDNGYIARAVEYVGEFREEGIANANLIAAAPELLEALQEARLIVANLSHDESLFLAKIDAAIAKAEADTQTPEQSV